MDLEPQGDPMYLKEFLPVAKKGDKFRFFVEEPSSHTTAVESYQGQICTVIAIGSGDSWGSYVEWSTSPEPTYAKWAFYTEYKSHQNTLFQLMVPVPDKVKAVDQPVPVHVYNGTNWVEVSQKLVESTDKMSTSLKKMAEAGQAISKSFEKLVFEEESKKTPQAELLDNIHYHMDMTYQSEPIWTWGTSKISASAEFKVTHEQMMAAYGMEPNLKYVIDDPIKYKVKIHNHMADPTPLPMFSFEWHEAGKIHTRKVHKDSWENFTKTGIV